MNALRTVILEHTNAQGVHHDWMIEDPTLAHPQAADAPLWTARVLAPPHHWRRLGRIELEVLPPHRRAYLTYQGEVSGNRGRMRRVAHGDCQPRLWAESRIAMTLSIAGDALALRLQRLAGPRWIGVVCA